MWKLKENKWGEKREETGERNGSVFVGRARRWKREGNAKGTIVQKTRGARGVCQQLEKMLERDF